MKVVLAPVGTRGDVQPLLGLGLELRRRGHEILVCAPENFDEFVRGYGFEFASGCADYTRFMHDLRREPFLRVLARQTHDQFERLSEAASGADVVVGSMLQLAAPSIAQHLDIPYFYMIPAPVFVRSPEHPPVTVARQDFPRWLNNLLWQSRGRQWNQELRPLINECRGRLGLPPIRDAQDYVLHEGHVLVAYDSALAPPPRFRCRQATVTGAWYLDEGTLDADLAAFCDQEPRPIFIGFGSMVTDDAARLRETILQAVARSERRAVIASGWSGLSADGGNGALSHHQCRVIAGAPFHLLFPRVAAAIHHGGAGTTAAAARAGIPQAIVPHFADQPFWGERIVQAGLGPRPVPIEELNTDRLESMIRQLCETPSYAARAREIARSIDPSAGVRIAADLIEQSR